MSSAPQAAANGAAGPQRHVNDVFLARNGFIRPNKKLWRKSTEHRLRPACSRCNFRGHGADECKVPYCTKCNRHGHPPKCCSGACANCNVGTSAAVEGEDDHTAEECPFAKCSNCGGVGHYTDECPHEVRRMRAAAARPAAGPRIAPAPMPSGAAPAAAAAPAAPQQQRRGPPAGVTPEQAREMLVNRVADVFPQHVEKFIDPLSHWSQSLVAASAVAYPDLLAALDQAKEVEFLAVVQRGGGGGGGAGGGGGGAAAAAGGGAAGAAGGAAAAAAPRAAAVPAAAASGAKAYVKGPDGKWHEAPSANGPAASAAAPAAPAAPPAAAPAAAPAAPAPPAPAAPPSQPISYLSAVRSQLPTAGSAGGSAPAAAVPGAPAPAAPQPLAAGPQSAPAAHAPAPDAAPAPPQPQPAAHAPPLLKESESSNAPSSADAPAPPPSQSTNLLSAAPGAGRSLLGGHGVAVGSGSMDGGLGSAVSPLSLAVGSPVAGSVVGQHLAAAGLLPVGGGTGPPGAPESQLWALTKRLQEQAAALGGEVGTAKDAAAAADAKAAGVNGRVATLEGRLAEAEGRAKSAEVKAAAAEAAALAARSEAQLARQSQSVLQSTLLQAFRQMGVDTRLLEYYLSVQGLLGPTAAGAAGVAGAGAAVSGGAGAVGAAVGGGSGAGAVGGAPGAVGSGRDVGAVGAGVATRSQDGAATGVASAVDRTTGWGSSSGWGTWS
ncbi:hypothetical protein Rsub_11980 [Raphidocelis subcapitata]|uniref:CCHC-type domain-containing protein n=1 Tax=Raphidocelis subcapitata TaxID=307507 RepID=A0A2V0PPC3_9CHLO|nr:hypothetical protein Rsub_11980 [Raphidocelis subcapitata]|eukprot:GBF99035.1 hypothetical protein Rsub_11980 [Raphidocelis subcapitata]